MPLYEYECGQCHRRTEKIQKFSSEPLTTCPHCGAEALERTITAPAFQFAGGGWYKDLYSSTKPAAGGESHSSSTSSAPDSAPAAATASEPAKPAAPAAPAAPATPRAKS
ncbi:MAG: zinc ribbon domain-containing protein [Bryocella sp.]